MRKPPLNPSLFTFSPTSGTVTFAAGATRPTHQAQIVSIVNTSNEIYLYLPVQSGRGGTYNATTGVLTLEIGTATMSSDNALQIIIDDSEIGATSTLQTAGNVLLSGISDKLPALDAGRIPVSGTFWQTTQPVSGPVTNSQLTSRLPILTLSGARLQVEPSLATDAATATNQAATNVALGSIDGKLPALDAGRVPVSGTVTVNAGSNTSTAGLALETGGNIAGIVGNIGSQSDSAAGNTTGSFTLFAWIKRFANNWSTLLTKLPTLTLSGARLQVEPSLATDAATATNQAATNVALGNIDGKLPALDAGRVPVAIDGAIPVVASPAAPVTASYTQATSGALAANTILIGPINCASVRMLTIQGLSIGTGGVITPEWAADSAFTAGVVTAQIMNTATGAIVTTFSTGTFSASVLQPWFRLRLSTATTAGIVQIQLQQWSETAYTPVVQSVLPAAGSTIGLASGSPVFDVSSATISASTTSSNITPSGGLSFSVEIPVSGLSGTNAWADFRIEETGDSGLSNWYVVYDLPRITQNGQYRTPKLAYGGIRWRYIQTLNTGTSLTRTIARNVFNDRADPIRQRYDRTVSLTTVSSVTPALFVASCRNLQMVLRVDAVGTIAPVAQLQGTEDDWQSALASWYNIGAPLTGDATRPVSVTVPNVNTQAIRGIVVTPGSGGTTTLNYVLLKGF